jgi:hypothetical protein
MSCPPTPRSFGTADAWTRRAYWRSSRTTEDPDRAVGLSCYTEGMVHVFRLGPFKAGGRDAYAFAGVDESGALVHPEVAHTDEAGLAAVSRRHGGSLRCAASPSSQPPARRLASSRRSSPRPPVGPAPSSRSASPWGSARRSDAPASA